MNGIYFYFVLVWGKKTESCGSLKMQILNFEWKIHLEKEKRMRTKNDQYHGLAVIVFKINFRL